MDLRDTEGWIWMTNETILTAIVTIFGIARLRRRGGNGVVTETEITRATEHPTLAVEVLIGGQGGTDRHSTAVHPAEK